MAIPSLDNPWFWDDLYWFRDYSLDEVVSTWTGVNNPEAEPVTVPGYRPLHLASNLARWELLGDAPGANRVLTVSAIGLGLALLVFGLRRFGIPLAVGIAAALLTLTSKNLTYTYAWVSDGYQGFQMAAFGATVAALALAFGRSEKRAWWLTASAALWAITLMLKDQGVVLLPVLLILALLGASGGLVRLARSHAEDQRTTLPTRAIIAQARTAWQDPLLRRYAIAVSAITAADFAARAILVPEAAPEAISIRSFAATLAWTASFAGAENQIVVGAVYCAVAVAGFLLWVGALRRLRDGSLTLPWLAVGFSLVAVASTVLFGFDLATRADIVNFPLFFYGLFVSSVVWLLFAMLRERAVTRRILVGGVAVAAAISVVSSVRASFGVQDAMDRWSVQALAKNYENVYVLGDLVTIPVERRAEVEATLRRVGLTHRLAGDDPDHRDPSSRAFSYLYCRELRAPAFPAFIPRVFAWGDDAFSIPDCSRSHFTRDGPLVPGRPRG